MRIRRALTLLAAGAIAASALTAAGTPALAQGGTPVTDAQLEWGLNNDYQEADQKGASCQFFSAGKDLGFSSEEGDVRIIKRTPDGEVQATSRASICLPAGDEWMNQRALFSHGTGELDQETGAGEIRWTGSFTANAYNGAVPWWIENPVLTVAADGSGVLTATLGGRGASMDDPDNGFDLAPREATVATFSRVSVENGVLSLTPDFAGVDYFPLSTVGDPASGRLTTSAIPDSAKRQPGWGSWPTTFVDFQYESGLASYWHTSGGAADPNKPPLPVTVTLDRGIDDASAPVITENPRTTSTAPYIEGDRITFEAASEGAESVRWERALDPEGAWTPIDGATENTFTIEAIDSSWDKSYLRYVASNAVGESASAHVRLSTVSPEPLTIVAQPRAVVGIEGHRSELTFRATGVPAPSSVEVELGSADGRNWRPLPGTSYSTFGDEYTVVLPVAYLNQDGRQLRVSVSNELGGTATSDAVPYRVAAATGGPQLVISPAEPLDPSVDNTISVMGAGFTVPESDSTGSYSIDVGVFADASWQPGQPGSRDWLLTSEDTEWGQLYRGALLESGGTFTATLTIPAGTLSSEQQYGVATFLRHQTLWWTESFDNREADTFTRISLLPPALAPANVDPESLTEDSRGGLTAEATPQRKLRVTLPGEYPGTTVALTLASGEALGWFHVDAAGEILADLPEGLEAGAHTVVAQGADGRQIGWAEFTLAEVDDETNGPSGPDGPSEPNGPEDPSERPGEDGSGTGGTHGTVSTAPGSAPGGSGGDALASTGGSSLPILAGSLGLFSGIALLAIARRRARWR